MTSFRSLRSIIQELTAPIRYLHRKPPATRLGLKQMDEGNLRYSSELAKSGGFGGSGDFSGSGGRCCSLLRGKRLRQRQNPNALWHLPDLHWHFHGIPKTI